MNQVSHPRSCIAVPDSTNDCLANAATYNNLALALEKIGDFDSAFSNYEVKLSYPIRAVEIFIRFPACTLPQAAVRLDSNYTTAGECACWCRVRGFSAVSRVRAAERICSHACIYHLG